MTQTPEHWRGTEPLQVLAPDGTPVGDTDVGLDETALRAMLRWMLLARRLDRECIALQRQGELDRLSRVRRARRPRRSAARWPWDPTTSCSRPSANSRRPWFEASTPSQYLAYHRGTWHGGPYDPRATRFGPICIPVATQIVHGVGYAMGLQLDGARACSIAYFGDGSASEGDFHEGANLAGVFTAPVILFCQNNGWAISVPTATPDRRGDLEARRWLRVPGRPRRRQRRARGVPGHQAGRRARVRRRRPDPDRSDDLPDRRTFHGRRPRALPRRCRGGGRASVRPDHAVPHVAGRRKARGRGHDRLVGRGDRGAGARPSAKA